MKYYNEALKEAESYQDDFQVDNSNFQADVSYEIKKNTEDIISLNLYFYKYSGGAHGYYEYVPYNIYMNNGEIISLENLFKKGYNYKEIINNEVKKQIIDLEREQNAQGVYDFTSINDNQKYYIVNDNIVLFFDLYEIAPYAAGIPEFKININKFNGNIKEIYTSLFK